MDERAANDHVVPYQELSTKVRLAHPAIDCKNETAGPLDYSFLKIGNLTDIYHEEPREPTLGKDTSKQKPGNEKSTGRCLRVNNNNLRDLEMLTEVVTKLFENPTYLGWLDLSFNELSVIEPVLTEFENLQILYLHGNSIVDIKEVEPLGHLRKLWKLTLHGNPVDEMKGYRYQVLSFIPWLNSLDFSPVTKADRVTASTWNKMCNTAPKKKKKIQTEA